MKKRSFILIISFMFLFAVANLWSGGKAETKAIRCDISISLIGIPDYQLGRERLTEISKENSTSIILVRILIIPSLIPPKANGLGNSTGKSGSSRLMMERSPRFKLEYGALKPLSFCLTAPW